MWNNSNVWTFEIGHFDYRDLPKNEKKVTVQQPNPIQTSYANRMIAEYTHLNAVISNTMELLKTTTQIQNYCQSYHRLSNCENIRNQAPWLRDQIINWGFNLQYVADIEFEQKQQLYFTLVQNFRTLTTQLETSHEFYKKLTELFYNHERKNAEQNELLDAAYIYELTQETKRFREALEKINNNEYP